MVNLIGPQLTVLVILILEIARSAPRSTIHQWLSSGADQKHVSSVNKPSTASPGSCSAWELLDVAGRGGGGGGGRGLNFCKRNHAAVYDDLTWSSSGEVFTITKVLVDNVHTNSLHHPLCACVCVCTCACVHMCMCAGVHVCARVHVCVCVCVCMCAMCMEEGERRRGK